MKQIIVMSGKGGTGKTTITAALSQCAGSDAVVADCDVDAANLHLLLEPRIEEEDRFFGGQLPMIDSRGCGMCGLCANACAWTAIQYRDGGYYVDPLACEGCGICSHVCPEGRITMHPRMTGMSYVSRSRFGQPMAHARLSIGQENSGKLVARVRQRAVELAKERAKDFVIVDGPPGIGCPAISAVSGADHVLIVTEATQAATHDLLRLVELLEHFGLPASCVINKADLDADAHDAIEDLCREHGIPMLAAFPWSDIFPASIRQGRTLLEMDNKNIKSVIESLWNSLRTNGDVT
ncbi:MAG: ATP-binding protein [Bacteroidota bacterium]|jgi:MinD superfamily P-loop ATPase|nr:ATP-binding protein [Bacteroidota bacterium]